MDHERDCYVDTTEWQGMKAISLEGAGLRALFVPESGAKLVSLVHLESGHEWLVGPGERPLKPIGYGATFVDQDMSGWDEMFPTIEPCVVKASGPEAARLPDHGEVWALPWDVTVLPGAIRFEVAGVAFRYRLVRTVRLTEPGVMRFDYELTNLGDGAWPYIWAAHPQFSVCEATRIVLPEHIDHVVTVAKHDLWGEPGTTYAWPRAKTADGNVWDLRTVGPAHARDYRKFYVPPDETVTWASLYCTDTERRLTLRWPADAVPYLGVWVDEGTYNTVPTVALEPATGYYDDLALAQRLGRAPIVNPGETRRWWLDICLA